MIRELSLERTLSIWWAFVWRAGLTLAIATFLVGVGVGYWGEVDGADHSFVMLLIQVVSWILSIPISIWAFRTALLKRYRGEVLRCVSTETPVTDAPTPTPAPAPATAAVPHQSRWPIGLAVVCAAGVLVGLGAITWHDYSAPGTGAAAQAAAVDPTKMPGYDPSFVPEGGLSTARTPTAPKPNAAAEAARSDADRAAKQAGLDAAAAAADAYKSATSPPQPSLQASAVAAAN